MLNFLLTTEKDRKEAAAIERRRIREEERKKRIFNPRARLIGNDYETLQKQIEEKKKRDEEEKKIEAIFQAERVRNDEIALALERKEKEERKKLEREINNFRKNYQRQEDRREFDLNDPNMIKRSLPVRLYDDDPRLGPSAVQKFEGEDVYSKERNRAQMEQMKSWLDQQIKEREAAEKERKQAEEEYKAAIIARDSRALQLDKMEQECRLKLKQACSRYNRALADERECFEQIRKKQEKEDNFAEQFNAMTSDLLTENPDVAKSNLGPGRQIGYLYKGMTDEEKESMKAALLAQIEEQKKRKELEKRTEKEYEAYFNGLQRSIHLMDKELEQKKKQRDKQILEENKRMGVEQKNQQEYLAKVVYTNRPTAAYFEQFNKGTR